MNKNILGKYCLLLISLCLCSCLWYTSTDEISKDLLTAYLSRQRPVTQVAVNENVDCYIDYSRGMEIGMRATSAINDKLKNFLLGKKATYYRVGASDQPVIIDISKPSANFLDVNNFKIPGSKLKAPIDKITADRNSTSVYITDFERVDDVSLRQHLPRAPGLHPIDATAWAQNNFKDWLVAGNQIDIFASLFDKPDYWFEKNYAKTYRNWIYTIVFTPTATIKDPLLYKKSVLKFLTDEYRKANGPGSMHFQYMLNNFKVEPEKKNDDTGDANDNLIVFHAIFQTAEPAYEYYEIKGSDLADFNNADINKADRSFINKIKVTNLATCLTDVKYDVKVYDVSKLLRNPDLAVAESTVHPGIQNKKYNLKPETEITDLFSLTYKPSQKKIGIQVRPGFTPPDSAKLYQVDIIASVLKRKDLKDEADVLQLNYSNDYHIKSLGESVTFALNSAIAETEGKVLYTIFIKIK